MTMTAVHTRSACVQVGAFFAAYSSVRADKSQNVFLDPENIIGHNMLLSSLTPLTVSDVKTISSGAHRCTYSSQLLLLCPR